MGDVHRRGRDADRSVVIRAVVAFVAAGLVAMIAVTVGVVVLVRHDVRNDAVREARDVTVAAGRAAIAPVLTDGVLAGDPAALHALDETVRQRVLSESILRVKVWTPDGRVVYSDQASIIGQVFSLGDDELAALTSGRPAANISDLSDPENVTEQGFGELLQVYDGLHTTSGKPVLFEAYLTMTAVHASSSLGTIAPAVVGGFVLLFVIQVPLAWRLARRVRRARDDRAAMLERALRSRDAERRRIAADLHDGIVQQLAGSAYSLAAAADQAERAGATPAATAVRNAAAELRQGVRDLRTLIITITPPKLHEEGLSAALDDLASSARAAGLAVNQHVELSHQVSEDAENLVFRTAQEAIRNVLEHASASRLALTLATDPSSVRLAVRDDGRGFDPARAADRHLDDEPHLGLRLLDELARDAGGRLTVTSAPGAGTTIDLEVPR
jgi:signal transduction histidine kinase